MPAAAVIRGCKRYSELLGVKARRRSLKSDVKARGLTPEVHLKLRDLSMGEGSGIPGVEVKFVDIRRNTGGEGDFLDQY